MGTPVLAVQTINSPNISNKPVSSGEVNRDANDEKIYADEFKVAIYSEEDQAVDEYLSTALSIGNKNYTKTGDFKKAVNDVRRYFAEKLGVPLKRSADGKTAYVQLKDGTRVSARESSKSLGVPTVQINRSSGKASKVRYIF